MDGSPTRTTACDRESGAGTVTWSGRGEGATWPSGGQNGVGISTVGTAKVQAGLILVMVLHMVTLPRRWRWS